MAFLRLGRGVDLAFERGQAEQRDAFGAQRLDRVGQEQLFLRGIDMFDCVLPTRSGRNGQAFTWNGPINLRNAKFAEDQEPIDSTSDCAASRDYSKAYLHHLVKSGEMLGAMLLTEHNLAFYQALMKAMRDAIEQQRFAAFAADFRHQYLGSS